MNCGFHTFFYITHLDSQFGFQQVSLWLLDCWLVEKKERVSELCERKAGSNLDRSCKQKQTAVGVTFDTFDRKHDLSPSGSDNVFIKRTGTKIKKKTQQRSRKMEWNRVLLEKKIKVSFLLNISNQPP